MHYSPSAPLELTSPNKPNRNVFAPPCRSTVQDVDLLLEMLMSVWKSIHKDWILEESETCWRPLDGPITERKARKSKVQREVGEEENSHSFCRSSPPLFCLSWRAISQRCKKSYRGCRTGMHWAEQKHLITSKKISRKHGISADLKAESSIFLIIASFATQLR